MPAPAAELAVDATPWTTPFSPMTTLPCRATIPMQTLAWAGVFQPNLLK